MNIPPVLTELDDFHELTEKQKFNFMARLRYIEEIALNIQDWIRSGDQREAIDSFLDDLELDVGVNHGQEMGSSDQYVSVWMVHTTWLQDYDRNELRAALPSELKIACNRQGPDADADTDEIVSWLSQSADDLSLALTQFEKASTPQSLLAVLTGINILMARLTTDLYRWRLRPD